MPSRRRLHADHWFYLIGWALVAPLLVWAYRKPDARPWVVGDFYTLVYLDAYAVGGIVGILFWVLSAVVRLIKETPERHKILRFFVLALVDVGMLYVSFVVAMAALLASMHEGFVKPVGPVSPGDCRVVEVTGSTFRARLYGEFFLHVPGESVLRATGATWDTDEKYLDMDAHYWSATWDGGRAQLQPLASNLSGRLKNADIVCPQK